MNEETKHKPYLYTIVGIGSLLAFAIIVQMPIPSPSIIHDTSLDVLPVPAGAEKYPAVEPLTCSPNFSPVLDEGSKIKFQIMTPHFLPIGYSLEGVDVVSNNSVEMITMYYWDRPLCNASELSGGPALNGAVVVRIAESLRVPDSQAQMIDAINKIVPKYSVHQLTINGNPAIGYDPSGGLSATGISDASVGLFPFPARIFVVVNKMLYNIEANMPLEDLVRIAESIK
ncbi:MAG: hypothetical protein ACE5J2_01155 [Nitrososphaerales archaeon]